MLGKSDIWGFFFLFLMEIFMTQARSTPLANRSCQCMQPPWGDDSWFFRGWWRETFESWCSFLKRTSRHFSSSRYGPYRKCWRTKGHQGVADICAVNCCCFCQPYVQLRSFYSAAYGAIIIEFFVIIDLTCIILFTLAELIQTDWD